MNAETVDARAELRKPVEAGLTRPPVVVLQPVLAQLAEVAEADALRTVIHCLRIRPARAAQPLPQVVEVGFGDLYAKGMISVFIVATSLHVAVLGIRTAHFSRTAHFFLTAHPSHTGAGGSPRSPGTTKPEKSGQSARRLSGLATFLRVLPYL